MKFDGTIYFQSAGSDQLTPVTVPVNWRALPEIALELALHETQQLGSYVVEITITGGPRAGVFQVKMPTMAQVRQSGEDELDRLIDLRDIPVSLLQFVQPVLLQLRRAIKAAITSVD